MPPIRTPSDVFLHWTTLLSLNLMLCVRFIQPTTNTNRILFSFSFLFLNNHNVCHTIYSCFICETVCLVYHKCNGQSTLSGNIKHLLWCLYMRYGLTSSRCYFCMLFIYIDDNKSFPFFFYNSCFQTVITVLGNVDETEINALFLGQCA